LFTNPPISCVAFLAALVMAGPAYAQAIGDASFVRKDVRSIMAGRLMPLNTGDTVYRDQIIRTAADSSTVLVFRDKSSMAIGPLSEVRLDEFVFKASAGPRTVDAVKGFFRFISGAGAGAHDYSVRTPHATIAVRGTTFDVRVTEGGTMVVLHDGAVDVCSAGECRSLVPGQAVETRNKGKGMDDVRAIRPTDWTYGGSAREHRAALDAARTAMDRLALANGVRTVASAKQAAPGANAPTQDHATPPAAAQDVAAVTQEPPAITVEQPKPGQTVEVAATPAAASQPTAPEPPASPTPAAPQPAPKSAMVEPTPPREGVAPVDPAPSAGIAMVAPSPAPAPATQEPVSVATAPPAPAALAPAPLALETRPVASAVLAAAQPVIVPVTAATGAQHDHRPPLAAPRGEMPAAGSGDPTDRESGALGDVLDRVRDTARLVAGAFWPAIVTPPDPPRRRHEAVVEPGTHVPAPREPRPSAPERINQAVITSNKGDGNPDAV
jgi:hypothetical protein